MAAATEHLPGGRAGIEPSDERAGAAVLALLALLVAASGFLLLLWGSHLTFLLDDWEVLVYRPGFTTQTVFYPHGPNIAVGLVLVYKALLALFGMGSAFPFRVVSTGAFLLSGVLLFSLLRRRVGQWPALIGTAVVLFIGVAWEDLLWDFQIGYFGSMAAGLGMLLALERRRGRWDALATVLLTVSILFSSLGLPFLLAAAVDVLWDRGRWRRLYVILVPAAVYAAWWVGWGHEGESTLSLHNVLKTPLFVGGGFTSTFASTFGLAGVTHQKLVFVGLPLAVAAVAILWWQRSRIDLRSRWLWVTLAPYASFWTLAGLNQAAGRTPDASRYQYVSVVLAMLVVAELLRGARIGRRAVLIAGVVAALAIAGNLRSLHQNYYAYRSTSQLEKADLAALDIVRPTDTVEPGFALTGDLALTLYVHIEAAPYYSAVDEHGTPAYDLAELAEAPARPRRAADRVMAAATRLSVIPGAAENPRGARPAGGGVVHVAAGRCASGGGATQFAVPRNGAAIHAGARPIEDLRLRRYSNRGQFPVTIEAHIPAGAAGELRIPPDLSRVPWKVRLPGGVEATICGLPAAPGRAMMFPMRHRRESEGP